MHIDRVASPNHNERKAAIQFVVLHYTGMVSGEAALERMCDPAAEVSAHYMVWEDGRVTQLVEEDRRAWHAGIARWQGLDDLNSRSIGIEIVNGGHDVPCADGSLPPYPAVQIDAVIALLRGILARHGLAAASVIGHSDIAPQRKIDPGEHFPWSALAAAGVAIHPPENGGEGCVWMGADADGLNSRLAALGYDVTDPMAAVRAFQRRFTPDRVTGFADARTLTRMGEVEMALRFAGSVS